jgi:hypothetical protein
MISYTGCTLKLTFTMSAGIVKNGIPVYDTDCFIDIEQHVVVLREVVHPIPENTGTVLIVMTESGRVVWLVKREEFFLC